MIRIKIRMDLDSAPERQHHGQPQLASRCVGDFLAANSTGTHRPADETALLRLFQRCFFRCRSSVPKLRPDSCKNSLLTNSATSRCTSSRVCRLAATNCVSTVIQLLQHRRIYGNRCVGQTLTGLRTELLSSRATLLACHGCTSDLFAAFFSYSLILGESIGRSCVDRKKVGQ